MTDKRCPVCRHSLLTPTQHHGQEIDVCHHCGGLWFEKDEMNSVLSAIDNGHDNVDFSGQLGKRLGLAERQCPDCRKSLQHYQLLEQYDLEVDVCHGCDGVWIDQDEIAAVQQSPRLRETLEKLNTQTNWKSWVFQFLSQMPVEYNIRPHRTPWVTWALIVINVLIYFSYAGSDNSMMAAITHFGSTPAELANGEQWWTPLTATFLHGSLLHLAGNMYFLWLTGDNLEDALGHWRFLGLYLLCGLGAGFVRVLMNWNSDIPSVGASGAIAGLFGMYMLWFRHASLTFMIIVWQKKLSPFWYFGIWLGLNLLGMLGNEGGVDYWAHIGGFIIGIIIGLSMHRWVMAKNPLLPLLAQPQAQILR